MVEVIPSIDVESFDEVKKRIRAVAPYVKWAHIDVSDGGFTGGYKSWHYFKDLIGFKAPVKLEIHLMINEMDFRWRDWVLTSADRLIFHLEAAHDPAFVITKIRENKKQVGLAIRPETAWQVIDPFAGDVDLIQTLAVSPGPSGQGFKNEILDKITHLRRIHPRLIIEADGGMNPATAKKCVHAGANLLVSGNYIFNPPFGEIDIKRSIQDLKNWSS